MAKLALDRLMECLDMMTITTKNGPRPWFLADTGPVSLERLADISNTAAHHIRQQSDRISELLGFNNQFEERARQAERAMKDLLRARPIEEYHEDMGDVLWWKFPITEPPYIGSPLDLGHTIEVTVSVGTVTDWPEPKEGPNGRMTHYNIGGWPGYHTHWTPLPDAAKIVKP